jgi:hypothetical protein
MNEPIEKIEQLKPCPFCGRKAYHEDDVVCCSGGEDCVTGSIGKKSVKEWNHRPIEDALKARIAELESANLWTPVSEKIPEDFQDVEIKVRAWAEDGILKTIGNAQYGHDTFFVIIKGAVEWRPLPEIEVKND